MYTPYRTDTVLSIYINAIVLYAMNMFHRSNDTIMNVENSTEKCWRSIVFHFEQRHTYTHIKIIYRAIYRTLHAVHQIICVGSLAGSVYETCFFLILLLLFPLLKAHTWFSQHRTLKQQQQQYRWVCVSVYVCLCVMWNVDMDASASYATTNSV